MALAYCVLASGSSGNCLWVKSGSVEVLVDDGLPLKTLTARLAEVGSRPENIAAVVCTHSHGDHVGGVGPLARASGAKIIATGATLADLRNVPADRLQEITSHATLTLGGLTLRTAPTPHDAPGSVCVVATDGDTSVGLVTDLGRITDTVVKHLSGLDALVVEMNHDPRMLEDGPYPYHLKQRIRGGHGHLSNEQGAELLGRVLHDGLRHVTLAHLSETNNDPRLVQKAAERVCERKGFSPALSIGEQWRPGMPVTLRGRPGKQLSLFAAAAVMSRR